MKKPTLQDYGLTQADIERIKSTKQTLKIVAVSWMFVGISLFCSSSLKNLNTFILLILLLLTAPPFGPIMLYSLLKRITLSFSPVLKASERFWADSEKYERWWELTQETFWNSMTGRRFEQELAALFQKLGYQAHVTAASDDKGIDIWLEKNSLVIPVQCKAHKKPVGPGAVREFYGAMSHFGAKTGIFASLSGFTSGAHDFCRGKSIQFVDLRWIIDQQRNLSN